MTDPFFDGGAVRVYRGHALDILRQMPDESIHMVVTSPPYWGLRSYKTPPVIWNSPNTDCRHEWEPSRVIRSSPQRDHSGGVATGATGTRGVQSSSKGRAFISTTGSFCSHCTAWQGHLGLEPSPELYINHLTTIFREVRRVLRQNGTLWIVIGDTYNSGAGGRQGRTGARRNRAFTAASADWRPGNPAKNQEVSNRDGVNAGQNYKLKDLIGISWMLAFALREDGWYLRSEIVWSKPDCLPESVTDRPTKAHETIFLLSKSERYFYDQKAVEEPLATSSIVRLTQSTLMAQAGSTRANAGGKTNGPMRAVGAFSGRNLRSVWPIVSEAFHGLHFAVFPSALVRRCILAGTSAKGVCATCGAPWRRCTDGLTYYDGAKAGSDPQRKYGYREYGRGPKPNLGMSIAQTTGWQPSCSCPSSVTIPAVVLDPFAGTGTSLLVARSLGRHAIGIELSEKYCDLIVQRVGEPYRGEGEGTTQARLLPRQPSIFDP